MNGALILNKPEGITSNGALSKVKKLLNCKKAGHTGTLDPFATGVLPILFNEATKVIPYLMDSVKEYIGTMELGVSTDTLDKTGNVINKNKIGKISESDIVKCFCKYTGDIKQTPPMFSAVKKKGVRLYSLARKGISVERELKDVRIEKLELLDYRPPHVQFYVKCSRGTYIRSLSGDIGNDLGCGGYLKVLKRISSGQFSIDDSFTIEDIKSSDFKIIKLNDLLGHLVSIEVSDEIASIIRDGKKLLKSYFTGVLFPNFEGSEILAVKNSGDLMAITRAQVPSDRISSLDDKDIILKVLRVINVN